MRERIAELKNENASLVGKIDEYRATLEELRIQKAQMQTHIQSAEDKIRLLRRNLASEEAALRDVNNELFAEKDRFEDIHQQLLELEGEIASIERKGIAMTSELQSLEKEISSRNSDVSAIDNPVIDRANRTVTFTLAENTDIRHVKFTDITYSEGATPSRNMVGSFDMRSPQYVTLSLYQHYEWVITATQHIDRR